MTLLAQKICEQCGAIFEGYPSRLKTRRFCSERCSQLYHTGTNHHFYGNPRLDMRGNKNPRYDNEVSERPCPHCGRLFRPLPSQLRDDRGKFCSRPCANSHGAIIVACFQCGWEFRVPLCRAKRNKHHFCSKQCAGLYNRGANNPFFGKKHTTETVKMILSKIHSRPNNAERKMIELLRPFPFLFVGDGSVIIGGLNPDFININGKKQVIELFGEAFHEARSALWKGPLRPNQTEEGRRRTFARYGFDLLIVWESDLRNPMMVVEKVGAFLKGGDKNVSDTSQAPVPCQGSS